MYLGMCEGQVCRVSNNSSNNSVCLTGISGAGKSCKINEIELTEVKNGNTVICIDISQNHLEKDIFYKIRPEYCRYINRINALKNGLGMNLFKPVIKENGTVESYVNIINSNVQSFSAAYKMGDRQKALLRKIIMDAMEIQNEYMGMSDSQALVSAFVGNSSAEVSALYEKFWTVLNANVFRNSNQIIEPNKINIIELSDLDILSAEVITEVILAYFWRVIYNRGFSNDYGNVTIVLDEFQHCSLKKGATLHMMLSEGRKFGINLILATQTMGIFSAQTVSILEQMATRLYFRPVYSSLLKDARNIEATKTSYWKETLSTLPRGVCVAKGVLEVNGIEINRPLILS